MFVQLGAWGRAYLPASEELSVRAALLEEGGPALWDQFMAESRETHVDGPTNARPRGERGPIAAKLHAAYELAKAGQESSSPA